MLSQHAAAQLLTDPPHRLLVEVLVGGPKAANEDWQRTTVEQKARLFRSARRHVGQRPRALEAKPFVAALVCHEGHEALQHALLLAHELDRWV